MDEATGSYTELASYRHCVDRINTQWAPFQKRRADCLRHGGELEVIAEEIIRDLFTQVLDWADGDLLRQEGRADIVLSQHLRKYLVLEAKRPGTLWPGRQSLEDALQQARRYADAQKVSCIGASDGRFIYVADLEHGTLNERIALDLARSEPPASLWWVSVHGIYRPCEEAIVPPTLEDPVATSVVATPIQTASGGFPIHKKYKLPASCFAYVGDATDPSTWSLPYKNADGSIDEKRLPKAIQALLSNYRGARVRRIPEKAIPGVLQTLARAAAALGRMPPQATNPARAYRDLATVLEQLNSEVGRSSAPREEGEGS